MDIDRVRYFHIFVETGSLVKASEVLHISQPALSKALKLLEREVGAKLLEADGRGLRLTGAGLSFKKETSGLLEQWLSVPERLQSKEEAKVLRLGSFEVFTTYFLERLTQFVELENLELHEFIPGQLEEAVTSQRVDVGITYAPIPKQGVDFIEVTKVRMGVFGLKKFQGAEFKDLPFAIPLSPREGTPSKVIGLDGWPDHKISRTVKFRVTMMESAMELCREGRSVAYLPNFVVEIHNKRVKSDFQLVEIEAGLKVKERMQSVFLVFRKNVETTLIRQVGRALRGLG